MAPKLVLFALRRSAESASGQDGLVMRSELVSSRCRNTRAVRRWRISGSKSGTWRTSSSLVASWRRFERGGDPPRISRRNRFRPTPPICRHADRGAQGREVADHRLFSLREGPTQGTRGHFSRSRETASRHRPAAIGPAARRPGGLYHPRFEFSNSIKSVAPALCPDVTYGDLQELQTAYPRKWATSLG